LDEALEEDYFDWRSLYIQIQTAGITDPHYHWQNFGNVTIGLIHELIEGIAKRDMDVANAMSVSVSKMACYMLNSSWFGGKFELKDFLPFMAEESTEPKPDRITKDTAIAFRRLIKENRLPNKVITAASAYMDDISALAS
jgi:hypothetical protein